MLYILITKGYYCERGEKHMGEINCTFGAGEGAVAYCKSEDWGRTGVIEKKEEKNNTGGVKPENTGEGEGQDQMQNYEGNL